MSAKSSEDPATERRHSIAVVSRRTGVTQLLLRAWERRYNAVLPERTATGRRRYSDADVDKLMLLQQLTGSGHRIGDIAKLGRGQLRTLLADDPGAAVTPAPATTLPGTADEYLATALDAVTRLDALALNQILEKALVDLSKPILRNQLITPLLTEIGVRWGDGRLRISHEHMATSIVTTFLSGMNARQRTRANAPLVAIATPSGQYHELGALLAASVVLEKGWEVLYLGRDLPAEDIAAAVRSRGAKAVLLSLVFPLADATIIAELRHLHQLVGPDLPIIVGGQGAGSYGAVLAEIHARLVTSDGDLATILSDI
ncbi:MAG: MerR family transcriptional regulator [Candidatus Krumholzibacteria bacterium]|nr:MerR family transcriptional regulator [Candidatus Krumholzibacteria bacterium]